MVHPWVFYGILALLCILLGVLGAILARGQQTEKQLRALELKLGAELSQNRLEHASSAKEGREEIAHAIHSFTHSQRLALKDLTQNTEARLEFLRQTVEQRLLILQEDNNAKLEKMRQTVDEKLHHTLEKRLSESFAFVSERLELVHQGLGEMQQLAIGVGDLKRVLTNVKTKGILGEMQLESLLEQLLSPTQYEKNVITKKGSTNRVEFAIKLPSKEPLLLPIDCKFPLGVYEKLLQAYELGDPKSVEETGKELERTMKKCAKDIRTKYIDPPQTTDFGLMFLPLEGLYAEVVKRVELLEALQEEKISVTGPTTLGAFLNSLQLGFRTLAIERRSSEVWQVLATVKKEFEFFEDVLQKTQNKLYGLTNELDSLVGKPTRRIQQALKDVQTLKEDTE